MNKLKGLLVNLLLFLIAVGIGIGISEFLCRKNFSNIRYTVDYALFEPSLRVVFKPREDILPGVSGNSNFITNSFGMRGDELLDKQKVRILAIGGSTTESMYIDQEKSWPYSLQKKLNSESGLKNVWVGNAGKSGLNSRDHIVATKILLDQLPKIDLILVLSGINDMTVRLAQDKDYKAVNIDENNLTIEQITRVFSVNPHKFESKEGPSKARGQIEKCFWCLFKIKYLFSVSTKNTLQDEEGIIYIKWRENRKNASKIIDTVSNVKLSLDEYSKNLNKIIDIAQKKSVKVVFITHSSLWKDQMSDEENNLLWMGGVGDFQNKQGQPYYSPRILDIILNEYNKTMLEVCKKRDIKCLDLAKELVKDVSFYYDDAHYNDKGSAQVATLVYNFLIKEHILEN